jgi:arginyl-tRNA synthetase
LSSFSTLTIEQAVAEMAARATRDYLAEVGAGTSGTGTSGVGATGAASEAAAPSVPEVLLETPRNPENGDWACSVAMKLARVLKKNPFEIAQAIAAKIPAGQLLAPPEVARPGFINLRLAPGAAGWLVRQVLEAGERYGQIDRFAGKRVLVEFVSANPTGPLHIGHARGAILGDALARVFAAAGYEVYREYYYNDAGVQMEKLGKSLRARYLQALGVDEPFPEDGYRGDYIVEIAERLKAEQGDAWRDKPEADWRLFTLFATKHTIAWIDAVLRALRIDFDNYFSETTLHEGGQVRDVLERLKAQGRLYEKDGAWWLKTVDYGDEKDRVVIKSDGAYTYLAPDIAYHEYKFARGFDRLVNVLGADHHGYIPRLKAAIGALGYKPEQLDCVIVQMVSVENEGVVVKQSKRSGDAITLQEVIDAIGADVTRFLFLTRSADSQMVFDFKVAMDTSMDNPLYYVQYAHARCCSLMRKAEEEGLAWAGEIADAGLALLTAPEELAIVRQIDRLAGVVAECAEKADPLPLTAWLRDLATAFHAYFTAGSKNAALRVVQPGAPALTQARLALIAALRQAVANGLAMVGVMPLERL